MGWRLGNNSNTILGEIYEKRGECLDKWAKYEQRPYLRGKMVDFLGRDFPLGSKSQNSGQTKHRLFTKCSDHSARRAWLAPPWDWRRGLFSGTSHTYPHLDEVHDLHVYVSASFNFVINTKTHTHNTHNTHKHTHTHTFTRDTVTFGICPKEDRFEANYRCVKY